MADDRTLPKATQGVRLIVLGTIVLAVLFVAFKASYTDVPPERLAAAEMISLAQTTAIAEAWADQGTLEGHTEMLLPPAQAQVPNSKGPFEWTLDVDGTLRGTSARYGVSVEFTTEDRGANWACQVTPPEHAPSVGRCAVKR